MVATRRPTQQDVAKAAGVCRATVSLVLNPHHQSRVPISEETRQRVLKAVQELGYTPNPVAQMLVRGLNKLIGVFTYEPTFPHEQEDFYYPFLTGIERGAQQLGYDILLFTRRRVPEQRKIYADGANSLRLADGAILLGAFPDRGELCRLIDDEYPFVYIGRRVVPRFEINWVNSDYGAGSAAATAHLAALGHRTIGFVGYRQNQESYQDRLAACQMAAQAAGVTLVVLPEYANPAQTEPMARIIQEHSLTGLMCADEFTLAATMDTLHGLGLRVPESLSVLCLGAIDRYRNLVMQPAYVRLDRPAVGEAAVRLLVERLDGGADMAPQHMLIPSQFVPGQTTAPPPLRAPDITSAIGMGQH